MISIQILQTQYNVNENSLQRVCLPTTHQVSLLNPRQSILLDRCVQCVDENNNDLLCSKLNLPSLTLVELHCSSQPSEAPSGLPSSIPSSLPSSLPSSVPSGLPSSIPSSMPSSQPSSVPSGQPSFIPSSMPSSQPSSIPSSLPSESPSSQVSAIINNADIFRSYTYRTPLLFSAIVTAIFSTFKPAKRVTIGKSFSRMWEY